LQLDVNLPAKCDAKQKQFKADIRQLEVTVASQAACLAKKYEDIAMLKV
jgi:hypothetical protein